MIGFLWWAISGLFGLLWEAAWWVIILFGVVIMIATVSTFMSRRGPSIAPQAVPPSRPPAALSLPPVVWEAPRVMPVQRDPDTEPLPVVPRVRPQPIVLDAGGNPIPRPPSP